MTDIARVRGTPQRTRGSPPRFLAAAVAVCLAAISSVGHTAESPTAIILASEQLEPDQIVSWTDVVWDDKGLRGKREVVTVHRETGVLQATLADELNRYLRIIDPSVLKGKLKAKRSYRVAKLGHDAATYVASTAGADLVLIARGTVEMASAPSLYGSGMRSAQVTVVAQLLETKSGRLVAAATEQAAQIHISVDQAKIRALREAAKACARKLRRQIDV